MIKRKISARSGYIFTEAVRIIEIYNCDSIISLACGYSMLGFLVNQRVKKAIDIVDTDLLDILQSRQSRYKYLPLNDSEKSSLSNIHHLEFDIEKAFLEDIKLASFFKRYKRPVIILEGITYFLNPKTRDWLMAQLKEWDDACIILECWPESPLEIGQKIKESFKADLNKDFKENLQSFMLDKIIDELKVCYDGKDIGVGEAELKLSKIAQEENQLIEQNEYYPIRIFTGIPNHKIKA